MGCITDLTKTDGPGGHAGQYHSDLYKAFNQGPKSLEIKEGRSGPPVAFSPGRCNLMCSGHKFFALFKGGNCHCSDTYVDDAFISKQKLEKRKCDGKESAFAVYHTGILENAARWLLSLILPDWCRCSQSELLGCHKYASTFLLL